MPAYRGSADPGFGRVASFRIRITESKGGFSLGENSWQVTFGQVEWQIGQLVAMLKAQVGQERSGVGKWRYNQRRFELF